MSIKTNLRPTKKNRLIDLVRDAGVDVSDWGNFERGEEWAAANPKYCYEWSFVQPQHVVVLNLWYSNLREESSKIYVALNMRAVAKRNERTDGRNVWVRRAKSMDTAIRIAFTDHLTVRAIIGDGKMVDESDPHPKAAQVRLRGLDSVPWFVTKYDDRSGAAIVSRGGSQISSIDQIDMDAPEASTATERVSVTGSVFVRDPQIRALALTRAAGRCEYCGEFGFVTPSGKVFLETHHIIPLSEGGPDVESNVAALCANHHREAHLGSQSVTIRKYLLNKLTRLNKKKRAV